MIHISKGNCSHKRMSYILYIRVNDPMESRMFSKPAYFYARKHCPKINSSKDFQIQLPIDFTSKVDFPGRPEATGLFYLNSHYKQRDVRELIRKYPLICHNRTSVLFCTLPLVEINAWSSITSAAICLSCWRRQKERGTSFKHRFMQTFEDLCWKVFWHL